MPTELPCSVVCPAIRRDYDIWYCTIRRTYVAPVEHRGEYGFETVRGGQLVHSGYNDTCVAQAVFGLVQKMEDKI